MSRRVILVLLIVIALAASAYAGGQSEKSAGVTTLNVASGWSGSDPINVVNALAREFEQKNPGIKVNINTTDQEQYKNIMVSLAAASSDAPDVMTVDPGYRMYTFAKRGLLTPIDEKYFPGGSFGAQFSKGFESVCSYNGQYFVMPMFYDPWLVFYNKDVFAKYDLKVPATWQEFMNVSDTLKANGIAPVAIGMRDPWTLGGWFDFVNFATNGFEFQVKLGRGEISYTDPKVKATIETLVKLDKNGIFMPNAAAYSWQEAANRLAQGQAAMYLLGPFLMDAIPDDMKSKIGFFKFPQMTRSDYAIDAPLNGYAIPKNGKNKEAALKYVQFFGGAYAQGVIADKLHRLPANTQVKLSTPDAVKMANIVNGAAGVTMFFDRDAPSEIANELYNDILSVIKNPGSIDSVLASLDKARKRIYADQ